MYSKLEVCVRVNEMRSQFINSAVGVRQGDPLSPNFFKIFINDLPDYIGLDYDPVSVNDIPLNSILYADDIVLISNTPLF